MQLRDSVTTIWKPEAFSAKRCFTCIAYTLFVYLAGCYLYFVVFTNPGTLTAILPFMFASVAYVILAIVKLEWAFYVLVFFMPLQFKGLEIGFGILSITDVMIVLLVIIWGLKHFAGGTRIFLSSVVYLLLVWMLVLLLSVIGSSDRLSSLRQFLRLLSCIVVFLFCYNQMRTYARILNIIRSLAWSSLFISLYGLFEFFYLSKNVPLFINGAINNYKRIRTFFDQPNVTAAYLAIIVPLVVFLILREKKRSCRWFYSCIFALNMVAIGLTFSRSGWLAFVVVLLLLPLARKTRFALMAMIFLGLFVTGFSQNIISRPRSIYRRLSVYTNAVPHIRAKPLLGEGLNTVPGLRILEKELSSGEVIGVTAHSLYLTLLVETGCLGLLGFFLFIGKLLFGISNLHKKIILYGLGNKNDYILIRCLFAGMGALFFTRLLQTGLLQLSMWVVLGLAGSTAVIVSNKISLNTGRQPVVKRMTKLSLAPNV